MGPGRGLRLDRAPAQSPRCLFDALALRPGERELAPNLVEFIDPGAVVARARLRRQQGRAARRQPPQPRARAAALRPGGRAPRPRRLPRGLAGDEAERGDRHPLRADRAHGALPAAGLRAARRPAQGRPAGAARARRRAHRRRPDARQDHRGLRPARARVHPQPRGRAALPERAAPRPRALHLLHALRHGPAQGRERPARGRRALPRRPARARPPARALPHRRRRSAARAPPARGPGVAAGPVRHLARRSCRASGPARSSRPATASCSPAGTSRSASCSSRPEPRASPSSPPAAAGPRPSSRRRTACSSGSATSRGSPRALRFMFENARDYDAERIRRRTLERYGREAVVSRLEAVYRRVLRRDAGTVAGATRVSRSPATALISAPSRTKNAVRYIQVSRMMTAPMLP